MIGKEIIFKNRPNEDGTLSNFTIKDCLIAQNGTPTTKRPQVLVHLPKTDSNKVEGAWFDYEGYTYHVIGMTAPGIIENTPTRWNRYCIAEKIY
jgi:hypothetical protein